MSAPNANTFSLTPPRRPGLDDFNGAAKVDDVDVPDPTTMPNAAEWNTIERTLVGVGKVAPAVVISITFAAGVPGLAAFACPSDNVTSGTFTITDNGVGDTSITWPAGTFPAAAASPIASINSATAGMITAVPITNGVQVITLSSAAAAADKNFTVQVF